MNARERADLPTVRTAAGNLPTTPVSLLRMNTERALIELGHQAHGASDLRERVLVLLCSAFEAEVGLFVAVEGGREVRAHRGLDAEHAAMVDAVWHAVRRDVQPVKERALHEGAATDRRVLGAKLLRTKLFQQVMAPVGGTETLFVVPKLGEQALGVLAFGRCGGRFSSAALARAKSLVPALSVVHRAAASGTRVLPQLTETELDLLDYLELGWGTQQIAHARGTSFFTVRNQLSALYRRLDVTNRAEAIGVRRGGLR
jgi:DNA-binding CsgD family transcriptional regulator